ncbi:MAG: hypothetical protein U0587_16085 [Candidatus Binatia bacterium]
MTCEERRVSFVDGDSVSAVTAYPDLPASRDAPVVILAHGAEIIDVSAGWLRQLKH